MKRYFKIDLQFFGDVEEPPKEPEEPGKDDGAEKVIKTLKDRLTKADAALAAANAKISELNASITALLDGDENLHGSPDKFWSSLRNIKKRKG